MGDVVEFRTKQKVKEVNVPERCYLRFSTPDPDGNGPVYVEWNSVSIPMLIVAEDTLAALRDILFSIIQGEEGGPDS